MNKREENIDSLRVIAAILVITLHTSAGYLVQNSNTFNLNFCLSSMVAVFTRVAVPIFLMISGRYLLSNWNGIDIKSFYKNKMPRVIIPFIAWNIIYAALILLTDPKASIYKLGSDVINGGTSIHLWFFYLIIELYILTPIFYKVKYYVGSKTFINISFFILFIGYIAELCRFIIGFKNIPLYYVIEFMGYFLIGYTLKDYKIKNKPKLLLFGFILFCILGGLFSMFFKYKGSFFSMYFHTSLNPLTVFATICLYTFFSNLKLKKYRLAPLAKYSLGIYGIHMAILTILMTITKTRITGLIIIDIILFVMSTFILSLLISILLYKFKFTRKIVN